MTKPLISCIMPTRNRRRFVSQAIWYFLRQDYDAKELIVVDDGEDAIADLIPSDARVRYLRLDHPISLGEKRNLACSAAQGAYIAHWDDDDWSGSQRLSAQLNALLASNASVCGLRDLLYYKPDAAEAWRYHYPANARPWLAGCTLLYRRDTWAAHPFPALTVGEDNVFVWQLPPEQLHAMHDDAFFVALIHGSNTSGKNLVDPHWQRCSLDEVGQRIVPDRDFYVALRNNGVTPRAAHSPRPSITVAAPLMIYDGYGSMAEYLILGLLRAGVVVNPVPLGLDRSGLTADLLQLVDHARPQPDAPVLYFCWPRAELERFNTTPDLFINTMWESSCLPTNWPAQLNRARTVIVPTRFVAEVCRRSGVTVPIEVVPEGIDPDVYHWHARDDRGGLTTLIVATHIERKNTDIAVAAWQRAFADDPAARLVIKSRFNTAVSTFTDSRISIVDASEPTRGIAPYYHQADVLLALGNEGFGLPLVEGMATGLPVIALNSEGQADVCGEAREYLLPVDPVTWRPARTAQWGDCGIRGIPGVEDVTQKLCWVAEHRDEAREMGRAASEWARRERNVWAKGPAVLEIMEQRVQPTRPLRQLRTVWTPSWGTACGIAEYTVHLAEPARAAMPLRISADPPDLRSSRLLHIQHEHSLFNDVALTQFVQHAKLARVPVIITEHSVIPGIYGWERDADVLLALTEHGAAMLRVQHPNKHVALMPHGCPTWFPQRKQRRGRVIGAFGFLEPHKGFWHLLDLLRALPDTELLLFSYAKNEKLAALWDEAAQHLPVRRVTQYMPTSEIARRLAAEADVLVFWYDQPLHAASSGAARVGLATGVPVMTSRTGWFADLHEVTYQPSSLIDGVARLLDDTVLREQLVEAANEYCHAHSWPSVAERHRTLWRSVESV